MSWLTLATSELLAPSTEKLTLYVPTVPEMDRPVKVAVPVEVFTATVVPEVEALGVMVATTL
jgi:hypothetical protein